MRAMSPLRRQWSRALRFFRTPKGLMLFILAALLAAGLRTNTYHAAVLVLVAGSVSAALDGMLGYWLHEQWRFPSGALLVHTNASMKPLAMFVVWGPLTVAGHVWSLFHAARASAVPSGNGV